MLWAWGWNGLGQCGVGRKDASVDRPELVALGDAAAVVEDEGGEALLEKGNRGVGLRVRAHPTAEGGFVGGRGDGGDEEEAGEHVVD